MATIFTYRTMREGYKTLTEYIRDCGRTVSPRGMETREIRNAIIVLESIDESIPLGIGRNVNLRIAATEAVQLIAGFHNPNLMIWSSRNFKQFAEDNGVFWGAYGTRISVGNQLWNVVRKLRTDHDTRQAIITLWDPKLDNAIGKRDYPCTLSLAFSIEYGKLCLTVTMRSNDVWLGLTYDVFQFTQLQWTIANLLGISPGTYTHIVHSLHLYERDFQKIAQLHAPNDTLWLPRGLTAIAPDVEYVRTLGNTMIMPTGQRPNEANEAWYYDQFDSFRRSVREAILGSRVDGYSTCSGNTESLRS